ncbi:vacuolar ATPase assembly integral membrane protein VMA21 homolog [Contarinia nasturtii]|uniref:vacuolar ATPase assembly integral membrane protein VMA21 homolog n=1 Tax=Contarinia nasturtii TaxID=265458 RepID=UPI0012D38509|nr:vacuolar ATPase assembly integral membrane protein VMA21 homolog [Contarinia nasturtii]
MGKRNKTSLESQHNNAENLAKKQQEVFFVILFYCLLIIISPIATFFGSKYFIYDSLFDPIPSNIWAAVSAVVALHIALGLYLYRAYFGAEETKSLRKQE